MRLQLRFSIAANCLYRIQCQCSHDPIAKMTRKFSCVNANARGILHPPHRYPIPARGYPISRWGVPHSLMGVPHPCLGVPIHGLGYPIPGQGIPQPGMRYPPRCGLTNKLKILPSPSFGCGR